MGSTTTPATGVPRALYSSIFLHTCNDHKPLRQHPHQATGYINSAFILFHVIVSICNIYTSFIHAQKCNDQCGNCINEWHATCFNQNVLFQAIFLLNMTVIIDTIDNKSTINRVSVKNFQKWKHINCCFITYLS